MAINIIYEGIIYFLLIFISVKVGNWIINLFRKKDIPLINRKAKCSHCNSTEFELDKIKTRSKNRTGQSQMFCTSLI